MNNTQKLTPKYWIVHNTTTDDVYIKSAHKWKDQAIENFLHNHSYNLAGCIPDDELLSWYLDHPDLQCDLFELKLVEVG